MNTTTSTLVRPAVSIGTAAMARLGDAGLFRRGVPTQLGGDGGSIADVTATARELQRDDQAAAWIFRVQRHAIELLVHAENAGLREFLLPQWLQGERAGTVPLDANSHPLLATPVGNALRLYGQYRRVVNLQWIGFSVVVPVQVASAVEWVVVRGRRRPSARWHRPDAPVPAGQLQCVAHLRRCVLPHGRMAGRGIERSTGRAPRRGAGECRAHPDGLSQRSFCTSSAVTPGAR